VGTRFSARTDRPWDLYKISNKLEIGEEILFKKIQNFKKMIPATTDLFHRRDERRAHVAKLRVVFLNLLGNMDRNRFFQLYM